MPTKIYDYASLVSLLVGDDKVGVGTIAIQGVARDRRSITLHLLLRADATGQGIAMIFHLRLCGFDTHGPRKVRFVRLRAFFF